jgi:hypothetical protein
MDVPHAVDVFTGLLASDVNDQPSVPSVVEGAGEHMPGVQQNRPGLPLHYLEQNRQLQFSKPERLLLVALELFH